MQQYNPYYNPQMVYQNNMGYSPMINTQQRLAQLEQQYPQYNQQNNMLPTQMPGTSQIGLNGRIIDDFTTITANDVPMDNIGAIFVKRDYTEIQHRVWNSDGTIKTTSFKPILGSLNTNMNKLSNNGEKLKIDLSDESTEVFMNKFDEVMSKLDKMEKSITTKPTTGRVKKESESE